MNIKKILLIIIGLLSLFIGAVGIILPLLPTTPFVLLSAGCFSISSPRLSAFIMKNKYFGGYIENYRNKTGVPRKIKIRAILYLWFGLIISMILTNILMVSLLLICIGIGVTIHLICIKTKV